MIDNQYQQNWKHARNEASAHELQIVEHGWEQHVIIDEPNGLVYRYPRHQAAADKLSDEVGLLGALHRYDWPVRIPNLRHHTEEYTVYDFIPGDVVGPEIAAALSDDEIAALGSDLGEFLSVLHHVKPDVVDSKKTKQTITLLQYYEDRIRGGVKERPHQPRAEAVLEYVKQHSADHQVVVHGDLHGLNMVVDPGTKHLTGVIDFSEIELGDPHQDFRKLFMTDERLLAPSIAAYTAHCGESLSSDTVKAWAYVNEWANIWYFAETPDHPTYQRAERHLRKWGEL